MPPEPDDEEDDDEEDDDEDEDDDDEEDEDDDEDAVAAPIPPSPVLDELEAPPCPTVTLLPPGSPSRSSGFSVLPGPGSSDWEGPAPTRVTSPRPLPHASHVTGMTATTSLSQVLICAAYLGYR
jgi:hypothetical protein